MASESGGEKKEGSKSESGGVIKGLALYGVAMVVMTAVAFLLVTKLTGQGVTPTPMGQTSKAERQPGNVDDDKEGSEDVVGPEYDFEELVVNPQGTGGTRFLKVHIIAELSSSSVAKKMEKRHSQLRHQLISIIKSKSIDEIDTPEDIGTLQQDIVKGLNSILGEGKIRQVYFTDFVIQ